jgi:excisionase family DNA binding protein
MNNPFLDLDKRLENIEKLLLALNEPVMAERTLHSVKSLAKELQVAELTIRNWIKDGKLVAQKIGGRIFISLEEFQQGLSEIKSLKYKR